MRANTLYHGDNLIILRRHIPDECADLAYLDPPFNTNRRYTLSPEKRDGAEAFRDQWRWDAAAEAGYQELTTIGEDLARAMRGFRLMLGEGAMLAYLVMMARRLVELRRVLKPTGSIYLHCDTASGAHLRLLMDALFGPGNFRNEIIWYYRTGGTSKRWFGRKHDTIYFYTGSDDYHFAPQKERSYLSHRYGFSNVTILAERGVPYTMVGMRDVWDIPALRGNQPEALGYPTQKPEALLERIVRASSREDDLVLDPFCGCGTALAVAQRLRRRWVGIDIHNVAIELSRQRLAAITGRQVRVRPV